MKFLNHPMNLDGNHKPSSRKTFKGAFCERFRCSAEQYRDEVLFQCMNPQNRWLLKLVLWCDTAMTRDAIALVEEVGQTVSLDEARELVTEYRLQPGRNKIPRIRFSSEKLLQVYAVVLTPKQ